MSCPMHDRNCTALCTCDELAPVKRENARLTAELERFVFSMGTCSRCDQAVYHKEGE